MGRQFYFSRFQGRKAAKSCFRGVVAAFDLGEFHWIFGRGSKILPPEAWLLPLTLVGFIGSSAEAAKKHVGRRFSCLWRSSHLESPSQRQQTSPSEAILVAFGGAPILCPRTKGSRRARRKPFWLPLTKTPSRSHERKATEEPAISHFSCLCRKAHPEPPSKGSRRACHKPF